MIRTYKTKKKRKRVNSCEYRYKIAKKKKNSAKKGWYSKVIKDSFIKKKNGDINTEREFLF